MTLPRQVSSTSDSRNRFGPYQMSDGNFYFVQVSGTTIYLIKTSDTDLGTWETANTVYPAGNLSSSLGYGYSIEDTKKEGNLIHVVVSHNANNTFLYDSYNVTSTSWTSGFNPWSVIGNTNELNISFDYPVGGASITPRPNGELIVGYNGNRETIMTTTYKRVNYSRRSGGTWTTNQVLLGAGTSVNYSFITSALGANNRVHFLFHDRTNNQIGQRTLFDTTLQTASTQLTVASLRGSGTNACYGTAVTSNANTKICASIANEDPENSFNVPYFTVSFDSANTPTLTSTFVSNLSTTGTSSIQYPPIWVDEDIPNQSTLYIAYVDTSYNNAKTIRLSSSNDNGITWGNTSNIETTANNSLSSVFSRSYTPIIKGSKTVLPFFYVDIQFVTFPFAFTFYYTYYDEYILRGGATSFAYGYIIS